MSDESVAYDYVVIQHFDGHAIGDTLSDLPDDVLAERVGSHLVRVAKRNPPAAVEG